MSPQFSQVQATTSASMCASKDKMPQLCTFISKSSIIPDSDSEKRYSTHPGCIVYGDLELQEEMSANVDVHTSHKPIHTMLVPGILKKTNKPFTPKPTICSDTPLTESPNRKVNPSCSFLPFKSASIDKCAQKYLPRSCSFHTQSLSSLDSFYRKDGERPESTTSRRANITDDSESSCNNNTETHLDNSLSKFQRGLRQMVDLSTLFIASEVSEDLTVGMSGNDGTVFQSSKKVNCDSLISNTSDYSDSTFFYDKLDEKSPIIKRQITFPIEQL
ncbi:unnamed protein product [Phytomonas sp. Hart1]|nr:unnamed protein product [Phytomonas sp. Hart1]|eukprot:CCW67645.1 unnamed protein product [Phytomonas sp. isolate Hart1]